MSRVVAVTLLLALAAGGAVAAGDPADALKAADQGWSKASQAKNLDQFMSFVADDIYMSGPHAQWTHGKAAVHDWWSVMFKDANFKLSWTPETAEVSRDGRIGYTRGTFSATMGGKPMMGGTYTRVWKKGADGKWRVAVDTAAGDRAW
jgi:ketosteroid isomerase-like protein